VRSHVRASFAASIQATGSRRTRTGLVCLLMLGLTAFLGIGAPSAGAVDTCPNAVFRTGPGAKLPDCRAYELVTPAYTGGASPSYEGFLGDLPGMFATDTVTSSGDSVVYHTLGGGLSGFSATGKVDRYRARRTASGWATEPISPGGDEMSEGGPGGVSPDHEYSVGGASSVTAKLWPAFAGFNHMDYLRTPNGYEPLARGSLGDSPNGWADWISSGGIHVIFTTNKPLGSGRSPALEPDAPSNEAETIYDRTPGAPTHVVSLLPGGVTPSVGSRYLGSTKDGTEVAFETGNTAGASPIYIRRNDTVTEEVVRPGGVVVGKELTCSGGPGSATLEYQWLRNGAEIGGATSSTYTTVAEDEGSVVQCRVTASTAEGTSLITSDARFVEPYQEANPPGPSGNASVNAGVTSAPVGTLLTCSSPGFGSASPTLAYQWLQDGNAIGGATSSTYTPVEADIGSSLQCRVTASNADGTAVVYSYNPIEIYREAAKATANPAISNLTSSGDTTPAVGDELSCSEGTWSGSPTLAYQWLRNGETIGGATSAAYTTAAADEGKLVQCRLTATKGSLKTVALSQRVVVDPQPAGNPPIQTSPGGVFGTPAVGGFLFCSSGGWEPSQYEWEPNYDPTLTFSYQWLRNGEEIGGATSSSYSPTAADLETVVQCRVTATTSAGSAAAIDANQGAKVITRAVPIASASLPQAPLTFDGIFNGRVFYSDGEPYNGSHYYTNPGNLYMRDLNTEETSTIVSTGDASIVNVSEDGSHVYFVSKSLIDGEGEAGEPNLGVWTKAGGARFIATVAEADVTSGGYNQTASINTWALAISSREPNYDKGRAMSHTRSTPDGTVFAFESTAQLTGFDNIEASAADCGTADSESHPIPGQPCDEVYRYDAESEELTCVSCGPGNGPATGNARLQTSNSFGIGTGVGEVEPATLNSPVEVLTNDGNTLFFESTEGLVPQDGNETKDVYRWKKGEGVALISTGQGSGESALYGVTPNGSDVIFGTREKLLPQDENGSTVRLYDARVDGGFPPPEETVTEPCSGDACQGAASAGPEAPNVASSSLSGQGNVAAKVRCRRGSRKVITRGKARCVKRKAHHRHHRHSKAGSKRGTGR
jgi:hypothetical protein